MGAGTGELGLELWRRLPAGAAYLGLDLSLGMLARFAERLPPGAARRGGLLLADGSRRWPLEDGGVAGIFCSRAAHRLDGDVFLAETRRVLERGGRVVFGSLERSPDGVRAALRRRMRELLGAATGRRPGDGSGRRHRQLAAALGGGERVVAASFEVWERPAEALAGWRSKAGLAGLAVDPQVQEEVLAELEAWAREQYDDLDRPRAAVASYELLIARPGGAGEPAEEQR